MMAEKAWLCLFHDGRKNLAIKCFLAGGEEDLKRKKELKGSANFIICFLREMGNILCILAA